MITEQQVQWAMDILIDRDSQAAKARAAHEHASDMDKVILAQLMVAAPAEHKTAGAREAWARMHPDYRAHLEQKRALAEMDYKARDRRSAAAAMIDAWRTEQSSARLAARVG